MKSFKFTLLFFGLLFIQQIVVAQYGYRPPQQGQRGYIPPSTQRTGNYNAGPRDAAAIVAERMPTYVTNLKLDAFKEEILRTKLIQYYTKRETLRVDVSAKYDEKQDGYYKLEEELYTDLTSIFSTEELEGFKQIQFLDEKELKKKKRKKKKKDKRSKKDKKEKGTH